MTYVINYLCQQCDDHRIGVDMNSYFPMALRFDNKRLLLVGGGNIAAFKLKKLVMFNPKTLKCVSRKFSDEFINELSIEAEINTREFLFDDLLEADVVIVAIDDPELQRKIYKQCQEMNILCNCVDLLDCCDFIFPSLVKRGDITIAINSNGKLPGFSAVMRNYLDEILPTGIENAFKELVVLRKSLPPGPKRMEYIREQAEKCFNALGKKI